MSIISRTINMYMNEKVLINYVKNEHITEKTISRGLRWDSLVVRGVVGSTSTSVACTNGLGCGYIHQMIK